MKVGHYIRKSARLGRRPLQMREGPPEGVRYAGVELTRVAADLIFEDYLARAGARLALLRGKTRRTHRDAAGNCQNLRTETD